MTREEDVCLLNRCKDLEEQCPCGHWGRSSELDRYVSVRCALEMGHQGPCEFVDQLAMLHTQHTKPK